jgi:hypothetical protein
VECASASPSRSSATAESQSDRPFENGSDGSEQTLHSSRRRTSTTTSPRTRGACTGATDAGPERRLAVANAYVDAFFTETGCSTRAQDRTLRSAATCAFSCRIASGSNSRSIGVLTLLTASVLA